MPRPTCASSRAASSCSRPELRLFLFVAFVVPWPVGARRARQPPVAVRPLSFGDVPMKRRAFLPLLPAGVIAAALPPLAAAQPSATAGRTILHRPGTTTRSCPRSTMGIRALGRTCKSASIRTIRHCSARRQTGKFRRWPSHLAADWIVTARCCTSYLSTKTSSTRQETCQVQIQTPKRTRRSREPKEESSNRRKCR